jgi:hypothetical protein
MRHHGSRATSPDRRCYTDVATLIDANRAALSAVPRIAEVAAPPVLGGRSGVSCWPL